MNDDSIHRLVRLIRFCRKNKLQDFHILHNNELEHYVQTKKYIFFIKSHFSFKCKKYLKYSFLRFNCFFNSSILHLYSPRTNLALALALGPSQDTTPKSSLVHIQATSRCANNCFKDVGFQQAQLF